MLAIIPSSQAEIASLKQQGVCCLMHQRMIEGALSGVVVRIDKIPVLLPLCHFFFFFFTLIYLLWKEVRKFSITYIYICLNLIKNIVFSLLQPGTMIEWGNYW